MNNSKKSHKHIDLTSTLSSSPPLPPTKLKIITNGNGISTAIPANGNKFRSRTTKNVLPAAETLDVYEFVSGSKFLMVNQAIFSFQTIYISFVSNSESKWIEDKSCIDIQRLHIG